MTQPNHLVRKLNIEDAEYSFKKRIDNLTVFVSNEKQYAIPHHHTFFEIIYITSGTLFHYINGNEEQILNAGDFIILDVGTIHEFHGDTTGVINVIFTPHLIVKEKQSCSSLRELLKESSTNIRKYAEQIPVDKVLHDDGAIYNMLMFLKSKCDNPLSLSNEILKNCILTMIMHMLEPFIQKEVSLGAVTDRLIRMIETRYFEDNLLLNASIELNYTIPYLSTTFKKRMGITFKEYLQTYRILMAKSLLDTTNMTIPEISNAVGYSDAKFFRAVFKKHTNMSPRQYKNTHFTNINS